MIFPLIGILWTHLPFAYLLCWSICSHLSQYCRSLRSVFAQWASSESSPPPPTRAVCYIMDFPILPCQRIYSTNPICMSRQIPTLPPISSNCLVGYQTEENFIFISSSKKHGSHSHLACRGSMRKRSSNTFTRRPLGPYYRGSDLGAALASLVHGWKVLLILA